MKTILKILGSLFGLILIAAVALVAWLSLREFRPEAEEFVEIKGSGNSLLQAGDSLSLVTCNIGYGGLDAEHDFFMDGGTDVRVESKEIIERNMKGIRELLEEADGDIYFLQEVDIDSKRSYGVQEAEYLLEGLEGSAVFAANFLCDYVPYPFPTIGRVHSGILTVNPYQAESAVRIALPTSFSWPMRVCQLKRCLLVERVPLEGSDKELVLVNLHLDAYDDGTGREMQTKQLVEFLNAEYEKGNYCIAGGDFNQTFSNVDPSLYPVQDRENFSPGLVEASDFGEGWQLANDPSTPTCRLLNQPYHPEDPKTQYYVLDGFLLSPNVTLNEVQTIDGEFRYTDHNPVKITVTLEK
ncbi:endonuclease/exonuclease/phosphatase family protein [Hominifimenecus sp. rT4P-3]|uniref:endonuclease/exonuclease/phosphatase family protein n=1 Tax=Hominifimenecus sp. rT4P-3 TaxID=3242979 RepID=UPI003DA572AC